MFKLFVLDHHVVQIHGVHWVHPTTVKIFSLQQCSVNEIVGHIVYAM